MIRLSFALSFTHFFHQCCPTTVLSNSLFFCTLMMNAFPARLISFAGYCSTTSFSEWEYYGYWLYNRLYDIGGPTVPDTLPRPTQKATSYIHLMDPIIFLYMLYVVYVMQLKI